MSCPSLVRGTYHNKCSIDLIIIILSAFGDVSLSNKQAFKSSDPYRRRCRWAVRSKELSLSPCARLGAVQEGTSEEANAL